MEQEKIIIRKATKKDIHVIYEMINGLAAYEKRPNDMTGSIEMLKYWLFEKKLATTRSRGINIFMIFQNIAQLKNRYDNDVWQEILGNCDTKICMGVRRHIDSKIYN